MDVMDRFDLEQLPAGSCIFPGNNFNPYCTSGLVSGFRYCCRFLYLTLAVLPLITFSPPVFLLTPVISGGTPVSGRQRSRLNRDRWSRWATGQRPLGLQTLGAEHRPGVRAAATVCNRAGEQVEVPVVGGRVQGAVHLHHQERPASAASATGTGPGETWYPVWPTTDFVGEEGGPVSLRIELPVTQAEQGRFRHGWCHLHHRLSHAGKATGSGSRWCLCESVTKT